MPSRPRRRRLLEILRKGGAIILDRPLSRVVEFKEDEENEPEGYEQLAARQGSKENSPATSG